jgi:hypothetical protein
VKDVRTGHEKAIVITIVMGKDLISRRKDLFSGESGVGTKVRLLLGSREGAPYSPKGLKDDAKTLVDAYGARRYIDADIAESIPQENQIDIITRSGGQSLVQRNITR